MPYLHTTIFFHQDEMYLPELASYISLFSLKMILLSILSEEYKVTETETCSDAFAVINLLCAA